MKKPVFTAGGLAIGGALALTCCGPLGGADPLDSGEVATAAMQVVPSSTDRQEERRLQDERIQRLSRDRGDGSTPRGSAGIDVSSDF
jgi:hypothetical protein